jgi:hypothetical protein
MRVLTLSSQERVADPAAEASAKDGGGERLVTFLEKVTQKLIFHLLAAKGGAKTATY